MITLILIFASPDYQLYHVNVSKDGKPEYTIEFYDSTKRQEGFGRASKGGEWLECEQLDSLMEIYSLDYPF